MVEPSEAIFPFVDADRLESSRRAMSLFHNEIIREAAVRLTWRSLRATSILLGRDAKVGEVGVLVGLAAKERAQHIKAVHGSTRFKYSATVASTSHLVQDAVLLEHLMGSDEG